MKNESLAIHSGYETGSETKSCTVPIYQTTTYELDNAKHGADLSNLAVPGNIYSRIMNPTNDALEKRIAVFKGSIADLAISSGSVAVHYAILTLTKNGGDIVSTPQAVRRYVYAVFSHAAGSWH